MLTLKKFLAYGPAVLASVTLTCIVGAVLPPLAGLILFVGGLTVMAALLAGVGESPTVLVLWRGRRPSPAEADVLAPAVAILSQRAVPMSQIQVRVRDGVAVVDAGGVGRRTVLISAGMIQALRDDRLPVDQAAATLGHAVGVVRSGAVRSDLALSFWTLPWQIIGAVATALTRPFRGLPLLRLGWKLRFIPILIAAFQAAAENQQTTAVILVVGCALTYLMGAGERAWANTLCGIGDDFVRQIDLADPLAQFLLRRSRTPGTHERAHALTGPTQRPQLKLVTPH